MNSETEDIEVFSGIEQPPLLEQLKRILDEYRNDVQIIKELIQNADDAEATSMKILYEGKTINPEKETETEYRKFLRVSLNKHYNASVHINGTEARGKAPALVFYNDAKFTDDDWKGIRSIYTSVKRDDPLKIGRFGLGFKSVFHLTDFPCIISGEYAMFINPHASEFGKICVTVKLKNLKQWHRLKEEDYMNSLYGTFGFSENTLSTGKYKGTLFWFPLRQEASPLSDTTYSEEKVLHLLQAFMNESNRSLIFLKTLCSIQLFIDIEQRTTDETASSDRPFLELEQMSLGKDTLCFKVEVNNESENLPQQRKSYLQELKDVGNEVPDQSKHWVFSLTVKTVRRSLIVDIKSAKSRWLVVNYLKGGEISEKTRGLINDKELGYPHVVGLAAPLNKNGEYNSTSGHVFCYQPLPQENVCMTGLPVHVNGFFALSQNRRQVRWPDQGDPTSAEGDKKIEWNIALTSEILPDAYNTLIVEIGHLFEQEPNQDYLLKSLYNSIPDLNLVNEHWVDLANKVLELCKLRKCMFTEQHGGKWVMAQEAVFTIFHKYPICDTYQKTVNDLLFTDGVNLVSVPKHVLHSLETVCPSLRKTDPAFVKSHLTNHVTYKKLNTDQKQDLLEFIFLDSSKTGLETLELLPLDDGSFEIFGAEKQIILEDQKIIDLFPAKGANFVSGKLRKNTEKLLSGLVTEETFCLQRLTADAALILVKEIIRENFSDKNQIHVCSTDGAKWKKWFRGIWHLIQSKFRESVHKFNNVPIFPLVSDRKWENVLEFSLIKMSAALLYIPSVDEFDHQKHLERSLQLLSVTVIKCVPEDIDIDFVRPFLHEETSESIVDLLGHIDKLQVDRYNNECDEECSDAFLNFLSERIHTKIKTPGLQNLKQLRIFKGHQNLTEFELVSLTQINDVYEGTTFPVRFPKQLILLKSDIQKTFAIDLGANKVSELEMVLLTLRNIKEYNCQEKKRFVYWIITNGSHFSYFDVQESLKEIDFLEATDGSFHKCKNLFDPSVTELCNLFKGEDVFPKINAENDLQILMALRSLGLKTVKNLKSADMEQICCKIQDMASGKVAFSKPVCKAFLDVLNENSHLGEKDRLQNKKCILIEDTEVESFPQFIPFKNRDVQKPALLCMPSEIMSMKHTHLVGSVMYLIDCKQFQRLSDLFGWERSPDVSKVIQHLYNVIYHYKPIYKSDCLPFITSIYNYLSDTEACSLEEVKYSILGQFRSPVDAVVWDGNTFQPMDNIYVEVSQGDVDMKPFLHALPVELKHLSDFFVHLGCHRSLNLGIYISTLERIKDSESLTDDKSDSDMLTDLTVSILNKIKKNYLLEFKASGKKLYFPTMKDNGALKMMPAESCTYCDEQWLKNMDYQFDDDTHYVHPDLPLATAEALGVPSLRQQMMSDTEAFEEWGQEEPLTRRLRNLLKEGYVDGFAVAKELFQNADDAGAHKLWILFDERENNHAKTQLISDGMAECQGPALWVYNDERFTEADFKNITKLSGATKEEDTTKIGKFGLGFCAVYNITDVPSFISGENFVIFDPDMSHLGQVLPGKNPGLRINFRVLKNLKMMKSLKNQFMPFEDVFGCKMVDSASPFFNGTLFRLPLRNKASDISDIVYSPSEVRSLFEKIMSMAANMFVFNQNVVEMKLLHLSKTGQHPAAPKVLFEAHKLPVRLLPLKTDINCAILVEATERKRTRSLRDNPIQIIDKISVTVTRYVDSNFKIHQKIETGVDWLVSWSSGSDEASIRLAYEEKSALPIGGVAIPLDTKRINDTSELKILPLECVPKYFYQKGHLYFFLPLPIQHRFPFHINSQFSVTTDRRQLKTSNEDDKNVKMKKWNEYLMKDSVTNALLYLLENLHCFGVLTEYQYHSLWPRCETSEILEHLPHSFYQKLVVPEKYNVFERDGQWFDIDRCVFIERDFRTSLVGEVAFETLSQLTEFVIDVPEHIYNMLYQADEQLIQQRTVSLESFYIDYFLPHLEDFASNKSMKDQRTQLLSYAVSLQNDSIDQWLKSNKSIPSQPNGDLKQPNELVDTQSMLAFLFVPSDGFFPESPFTDKIILDKLRKLGLMDTVLNERLLIDRARSVESLCKKCFICALERSGHLLRYLSDQISNHMSVLSDVQNTKFIPVMPKPNNWAFEWHADIFSSSKASKTCKTHRKAKRENQATYFDRAPNVYYSSCKNIIGCIAFVFDENCFLEIYTERKTTNLRSMLKEIGMNGVFKGEVDVQFVVKQLDIISKSYNFVTKDISSTSFSPIIADIYKHLDNACKSESVFKYVAEESREKSVVFMTETFISPKKVSRHCVPGCEPYLYQLKESPVTYFETLCKCLNVPDYFPPFQVAMVLQDKKLEKGDKPLAQSEVRTMINVLFCLRESIEFSFGPKFEVQNLLSNGLEAIYGPDEDGILRECKTMCFNDYDDIEKSESMIYAHDSLPLNLAKYFGVKRKLIHNLEESSEDIEDFYQDEPLVTRLNRLVDGYPCDSGIFKELMQNADDAQATEIHFIKDYTTHPNKNIIDEKCEALQGPALVVYNNSAFSNADLEGIKKLGRGNKSDDPSQTGRYGVGFNAVYNLTDVPSFYTIGGDIENGETLCFFDPLAKFLPNTSRKRPGKRYKNVKVIRKLHSDMMAGYHEKVLINGERGTIFRFPLRTQEMAATSEIKDVHIDMDEISSFLETFVMDMSSVMLFLKNLKTVKVSTCKNGIFIEDVCIEVTMDTTDHEVRSNFVQKQMQMCHDFKSNRKNIFKFEQYTASYELSMNIRSGTISNNISYIVVQTVGFDQNKEVSELIKKNLLSGKLGLLPHGGVALQIQSRQTESAYRLWEKKENCKAFCFLPLPITTGLPVHVHGYFALDHETRRSLWCSEESETCHRSLWNLMLMEHVISVAYVYLLQVTREIQFQGITNKESSFATVSNLLSNYQSLFPVKVVTDNYWKHLMCSVYIRLVEENDQFLPVQSIRGNVETVQLTWTSLKISVSKFPAYINAESSLERMDNHSHFNNILRRIGMRIVFIPDEMKKALDFSKVCIEMIQPEHVITFMCSSSEQDTTAGNECKIETEKPVSQTVLHSVEDAANILTFCMADFDQFNKNFEKMPLMITQDKIVRKAPVNGFFFVEAISRFCTLFPTKLQRFLHSSITRVFATLGHINDFQGKLKRFTLSNFVELVHETNIVEHESTSVKLWDMTNPPKSWVRIFWDFFLYQHVTGTKESISQQLHIVHRLPVIPVTRALTDELRIAPPSCIMSLIDVESFSADRVLHPILTKLDLPRISDAFFSAEFVAKGYKLLLNEVPNSKRPLDILECLHLNSYIMKLPNLTDQDGMDVLSYFNNCLEDNISTDAVTKLKALPLFLSHFGKRVPLTPFSTVHLVPNCLPQDGIEDLADKAGVLFLKSTGHERLFKLLRLKNLSVAQVYIRYIIPKQHLLQRECLYRHLFFLSYITIDDESENAQLLGLLRMTNFVETQSGRRVYVSDLFDSDNEVFTQMCENSELVPECLRKVKILHLFRKIGLKTKMTMNLFERFAKQISSRQSSEPMSERVKQQSMLLSTHLLSMPDNFFQTEMFGNIAKIPFVMPYVVNDKLSSIKEQFNNRSLICFDKAVVKKSEKVCWTVSNILPHQTDPSYYGTQRSNLRKQKLNIREKPSLEELICHCKNVSSSLVKKLKLPEAPCHKDINEILLQIYETLTYYLNSGEFVPEYVQALANDPIVYHPDFNIIVPASRVTIECKPDEEILPYFVKCPDIFLKYKQLFIFLGATQEPSCSSFANVLSILKDEVSHDTDHELNPPEFHIAEKATGQLYKYLVEAKETVLIQKDQLYLLSCRLTLENARMLVIPDNKYLQKRLAESETTTYIYHIGFENLQKFHLKSEDCIESIQHLPQKCRPYLLTNVVSEKVILENIKHKDERKALKVKEFIQSKAFVSGFLRLVRYIWKSDNRNWTVNNEAMISQSLAHIKLMHCSGIETKLAMRTIEKGNIGTEIQIEKTMESKSSHIEESEESACIFFDSSDEDWQGNVTRHLAVYLHRIANECFKGTHFVTLMGMLGMYDKPEGISLYLSKAQIEEYTFEHTTPDDCPSYPTPGTLVPKKFHRFLDNDLVIYAYEFKFIAYEVDDPQLNFDEEENEDENEKSEEPGKSMEPTYMFVHIIRKVGPENPLPLFQEYEIDCGADNTVIVKGSQLFKFIRKQTSSNNNQKEITLYERSADDNVNKPERLESDTKSFKQVRRESDTKSFKQVRSEIRQYLREAWTKDVKERKQIVKRLFLRWHPDKNPDDVSFCTKVFQYIQQCLSRLENGKDLPDYDSGDEENKTNSSWSSSGTFYSNFGSFERSWYNRYWRRYTRGTQHSEWRNYRSQENSRNSDCNFENEWRDQSSRTEYEPYHWYSRARLWYTQAKYDLRNASNSFLLSCPQYNWVCYNAHQAAEKALKAMWYAKDANKIDSKLSSTHDLEYIASGIGSNVKVLAERLSRLTGYHTKMRYPDPIHCKIPAESFSRQTAETVIEIAQDILNICSSFIKE